MTEWIEQDKKDENHLYVHLKDPSLLDLSIFDECQMMIFVFLVC